MILLGGIICIVYLADFETCSHLFPDSTHSMKVKEAPNCASSIEETFSLNTKESFNLREREF